MSAAASAFLAGAVGLHPVLTPDLWWHLASGRWILEHGAVPRTDVLSYTMRDHSWTNLQWLTDVLLVGVWGSVGPDGLVLAKVALLGLTAFLVVRSGVTIGAQPAAAGVTAALAALAGAERTLARPEILSGLLLALTWLLVHRAWRGGRGGLLALPLACLAWANLHALAFLGPSSVLLAAALALLDGRLPQRWRHAAPRPGLARDLALAGVAGAVAMLVNPYGVAAWTFPVTLFSRIDGNVEIFSRILEFGRPVATPGDPALRFYWVTVLALVGSFAALWPRFPVARLGFVLPFLVLSLLARRNVPLFALSAAPVLALNLTETWRRRSLRRDRYSWLGWLPPAAVTATALAILGGASPALLGLWRDRGLFVTPDLFPEEALAELDRSGIRGNLFHDLDFGGYLVWRDPERRSFIDGRLEVAGPEWFRTYVEAHESPAGWRRVERAWGPQVLLLQHSARGSAAFLRALLDGPEWHALHLSPEAALLVHTLPETTRRPRLRPAADDWERVLAVRRGPAPHAGRGLSSATELVDWIVAPRVSIATVRRGVRYANLCLTMGWVPEARTGYEAVLAISPDEPEALFNLGHCDLREGRPDDARARWEAAMPRVDRGSRELFRDALRRLDEERG